MTTHAAKLLDDALKLSDSDRADLASCLFASLHQDTCDEIEVAWEAEIQRRLTAVDTDRATLFPWREARKRIFNDD